MVQMLRLPLSLYFSSGLLCHSQCFSGSLADTSQPFKVIRTFLYNIPHPARFSFSPASACLDASLVFLKVCVPPVSSLHFLEPICKIFAHGFCHLFFVRSIKTEFKLGALRCGKRHDADNGFTVDLEAILIDIKIGFELTCNFNDCRRRARMQSGSVQYGNGSCDQNKNTSNKVRGNQRVITCHSERSSQSRSATENAEKNPADRGRP